MSYWPKRFPWILLILVLWCVRWTKGAGFADVYAFLSRPLWPGSSQKEWIQKGYELENLARIDLLEKDNIRLREMLSLSNSSKVGLVSAAVIARTTSGWWQQLELSKGGLNGIKPGDAVLGPGGLLGSIYSVTPTTSRVRLLTAPGNRLGVWVSRAKRHGILLGIGTNRPYLRFLDSELGISPGDLVSTSPASSLMPPNVPIGVIQSVNEQALPTPEAIVQLTASPQVIDWVQVQTR